MTPPRNCPVCGIRVFDGSRYCLSCWTTWPDIVWDTAEALRLLRAEADETAEAIRLLRAECEAWRDIKRWPAEDQEWPDLLKTRDAAVAAVDKARLLEDEV